MRKQRFEGYSERNNPGLLLYAIVMFILALILFFITVVEPQAGTAIAAVRDIMRGLGGSLIYGLPLVSAWAGLRCMFAARGKLVSPLEVFIDVLIILAIFAGFHVFFARRIVVERMTIMSFSNFVAKSYEYGQGGGVIGALLGWPLYRYAGKEGGFIAAVLIVLLCLTATGRLRRLASFFFDRGKQRADFIDDMEYSGSLLAKDILKEDNDSRRTFKPDRASSTKKTRAQEQQIVDTPDNTYLNGDLKIKFKQYETPEDDILFDIPPRQKVKKEEMMVMVDEKEPKYIYPPIDLLEDGELKDVFNYAEKDKEKAYKIVDVLQSFGIKTKLTGIVHGPSMTRFELQPPLGIKMNRITSLSNEIALHLAATSVYIEAPIPGKAAVGVDIPNDKVEMVRLRDVLESAEAHKHPSRIAVGLGKDNSGRYIVADIAKMPHVLIAGQTGSGKSVCINSIIASILFRASPEEVRLILIDPKVVELSIYNDIPHLVCPVVTDPKKAASTLDWAVAEMTKRYKMFAEKGVRDIKGYNKALDEGEKAMPQMVVIIEELTDLMMMFPDEVDNSICQLGQSGSDAGIHMVISTYRPFADVFTGQMRNTIPTRIAFATTSEIDSRLILGIPGVERLCGFGDMLYLNRGEKDPLHVWGSYISTEETCNLVDYIRKNNTYQYDPEMIESMKYAMMSDDERAELAGEYDPKLAEAVDIVLELGQASISMLQRRMRIGYARAGRIIDEMARRGIVSEADGAKPRTVLMSREQINELFEEEGDA